MNNDPNNEALQNKNSEEESQKPQVPNPFEPGEENKRSQEEIDNEQLFKEALSERD